MATYHPPSAASLPLATMRILPALLLALPVVAQESKPAEPPTEVRFSARFIDSLGQPIAGVGLALGSSAKENRDSHLCISQPQAVSDAEGRMKHSFSYTANNVPTVLLGAKNYVALTASLRGKVEEVDGKKVRTMDLGEVVMRPGFTILGMVRDAAGKPLAGARASTRSVLDRILADRQRSTVTREICYGISDERGLLRLAGIPKSGVQLSIEADGHYQEQLPFVSRHTPLVVEMTPGGVIAGRVLDEHGNPPDRATVRVYSESTTGSSNLKVDAAGNFRGSLPGPGRYRLRYYIRGEHGQQSQYQYSKVYTEPRQDLLFRAGSKKAEAATSRPKVRKLQAQRAAAAKGGTAEKMVLQLLDARNGMPIAKGRGTLAWWPEQNFQWNIGYLEQQLQRQKDKELGKEGLLELAAPRENEATTGRAIVAAPGFAPKMIKDLNFEVGKDNRIKVRLDIEAVLQGKVVDPKTKEGIEGVKVFVMTEFSQLRNYNPPPVRRKLDGSSALGTTDKDGKFKIGQLAKGKVEVYLAHPKRTDIPPIPMELEAGATKDVELEYPKGASLIGSITGIPLRSGAKVAVTRMPEPQRNFGGMTYGLSQNDAREVADIDAKGHFRFDGLPKANYLLTLLYPHRQGFLELKMEPVRMRRSKNLERTFDLSDDLPATLTGRVQLKGGAIPTSRLMVVASKANQTHHSFSFNNANVRGHCAMVQPDGRYEMSVDEGRFTMSVVDLRSGLTLWQSATNFHIPANDKRQEDIEVPLGRVVIELVPDKEGQALPRVSRVEIRAEHPQPKGLVQRQVFMGNNNYEQGIGVHLERGAKKVELFLPPVPCKILARSDAHQLDPKMNRHNFSPLGEVEVKPEAGKSSKTQLRVSAPNLSIELAK